MKKRKKRFYIGGISLISVISILVAVVFITKHGHIAKPVGKDDSGAASGVLVDDTQVDKETASMQALIDGNEKIDDDGTGLKADAESEPSYQAPVKGAGGKIEKQAEKKALPKEQGKSGLSIGSSKKKETYNCKTKNHHCDGPETHAFILNLELEGCPTCGSHTCKSFYVTDKWGHTCYTPSKCPKYNNHNDAAEYCQKCGKKCGDGGNGTCVQYIQACNCPICGKWVESMTCHSH